MKITKAMLHLADRGVKIIYVEYSGGGDSGQIDNIRYYTKDDVVVKDVDDKINDLINNLSYKLLDDVEDWYNNDGGYGKISINVPEGTYNIENNIYYNNVETYEHEGNLNDEE